MLSNHLKGTYTNNYQQKDISSPIKVDVSQRNQSDKDFNQQQSNQTTYHKNKLLSTQEKISKLDEVVHNPLSMNTLILKTKLSNSYY
mgnify:FL=1